MTDTRDHVVGTGDHMTGSSLEKRGARACLAWFRQSGRLLGACIK